MQRRLVGTWVLLVTLAPGALANIQRLTADDVGLIYAEARFQRAYDAFIAEHGAAVSPRPVEEVPVAADTFGIWAHALNPQLSVQVRETVQPSDPFENWIVITPEARQSAEADFFEADWAYLGNNYFTSLDTVSTTEIRARMERQFGPPTKTLPEGEFTGQLPQEAMQFEYWVIVNDSIRVMFMDTGGPFDRGVLVAGDHRYRDELYRLRQTLVGAILTTVTPAPHVDYYYHGVTERWYRTGFNGETYFIREIRRPDLSRGRPELLPTDR